MQDGKPAKTKWNNLLQGAFDVPEEELGQPEVVQPDFWERFNQPVTTARQGLEQLFEGKIPTGGATLLRGGLEFLATPFTLLGEGIRQGEQLIEKGITEPLGLTDVDIQETTGIDFSNVPTVSEIIEAPGKVVAEGVPKGTETIEKGLKELGLDTKKFDANMVRAWQSQGLMPEGDPNKLADELTKTGLGLNTILAQFAVYGEIFGTLGRTIRGTTGVKSLSPFEGLRARREAKILQDINKGKVPKIDLQKEALELQKMLESEKPLGEQKTKIEKQKTPIETGKKLSEDKRSILEHELGLIEGIETKPTDFMKPSTIERITSEIAKAEGRRGKFETIKQKERSRRAGALQSALESENVIGTDKLIHSLATQGGKFERPGFKPIKIKDAEIEALMSKVMESPKLQIYEKINAGLTLNDIIGNPKMKTVGGRVPTNRELALLEQVFGKDFTEAIKSHRGKWDEFKEQFKNTAVDILNIPRAIMASADMSAVLRQGLPLTIRRPKQSIPAFGRMVKDFFSDEFFRMQQEKIQNSPNKELYDASGLEFTKSGKEGRLSGKEEAFMTQIAERLPFEIGTIIRASERAYVGFLNDMRAGTFDAITENFKKLGIDPKTDAKVYSDLARFVNIASGRGHVGSRLREMTPILNNLFFSIRSNLAKIQLPWEMINPKSSPIVRKEAAKTFVTTIGTISAITYLASLAGAEVETNLLSSDVGKIKIGNTRIDPWAGGQQGMRYLAQTIMGQYKDISSGKIIGSDKYPYPNRLKTIWRGIRSKFAPGFGIGINVLEGKDFLGEKVTLENQVNDIVPFAVKDIYEAVQDQGISGFLLGIPTFFGTSLQTFEMGKKGGLQLKDVLK